MNRASFLGSGWARSGESNTGVVRRAYPASGAQWNVQVVRGRVNGKCLWNACKALSLGLLLMVLGAAMATIGYFADHLSVAQEVRGNHTIKIRNESRGFHLNNLSYAGPIVMGVGGFIVVAACVMTFEARDSAAKVVPARLKLNSSGPYSGPSGGRNSSYMEHSTLRTSGSQTVLTQRHNLNAHQLNSKQHVHAHHDVERRALTNSFLMFSRGLVLDGPQKKEHTNSLVLRQQSSVSKSPSAPNLAQENNISGTDNASNVPNSGYNVEDLIKRSPLYGKRRQKREDGNLRMFATSSTSYLHPGLQRHALSVDETAHAFRHDFHSDTGSQGSMALDLHLENPVTLRVRDRRRNTLRRQQRVDEEDRLNDISRRSSRSCSPRLSSRHIKEVALTGGSEYHLPTCSPRLHHRRNSNASDCSHHRSRSTKTKRERKCLKRHQLERAISSDSRLMGAVPKTQFCMNHPNFMSQTSSEQDGGESKSDNDLHHSPVLTHVSVHKT